MKSALVVIYLPYSKDGDYTRIMKHANFRFRCLVCWACLVLPGLLFADGKSNRAVVMLRPGEFSFWNTATNKVLTVPVDMPPLATAGTLTVCGTGYSHEEPVVDPGDIEIVLPPATSPQTENVYELTLSFNDGTVRRAKLGLVQGYAAGNAASTRVLAPKDDAAWKGVKKRAVIPIPCGMASFTVNGEEVDAGLGGNQGWYALSIMPDTAVSLSGVAGDVTLSAALFGLYNGFVMSLR